MEKEKEKEKEKILITGTGRCGTTFIIKLFSFLDFNTGYTRENYKQNIYDVCNSGMERKYTEKFYILKNPEFINQMETIVKSRRIKLKHVIIPIRDYDKSAKSRTKLNRNPGGLWNAKNEQEQLLYYNKIMSNYVFYMTKYEISTIFLDFDKMISNKQYLFDKLKVILDEKNITFEAFSLVYDEVSETSKPRVVATHRVVQATPVAKVNTNKSMFFI